MAKVSLRCFVLSLALCVVLFTILGMVYIQHAAESALQGQADLHAAVGPTTLTTATIRKYAQSYSVTPPSLCLCRGLSSAWPLCSG